MQTAAMVEKPINDFDELVIFWETAILEMESKLKAKDSKSGYGGHGDGTATEKDSDILVKYDTVISIYAAMNEWARNLKRRLDLQNAQIDNTNIQIGKGDSSPVPVAKKPSGIARFFRGVRRIFRLKNRDGQL